MKRPFFVAAKSSVRSCKSRKVFCSAAVALAISVGSARGGTNGTYTNATTGGTWSDPNNWLNSIVADGQDGIANFNTLDITATNTVHLDTPRTIGTLNFADATTASNDWIVDNNGTASNILTLSTSTGTPTISVTNRAATISANLAGTQGFSRSGSGTLVLAAANTGLSGPISTSGAGILQLTNGGAFGSTSGVAISSTLTSGVGNQIELRGVAVSNVPLAMVGGGGSNRTGLRSSTGSSSWTGTITVAGTTNNLSQLYADGGSLTVNAINADVGGFTGRLILRGTGSSGTINGVINIPNGGVGKTDNSTWTIASSGNSWGATQVSSGTLKIGATNALPITTPLTIGQAGADTSTFDLNGFDQTVSQLIVSTTTGTNTITNSAAAVKTFTVNTTTTDTFVGSGSATSARITGALNLVKAGTGSLALGGANTYTGTTTINAGTLTITGTGNALLGSTTSTADVIVADAGLLDLQKPGISDLATLKVTSTDPAAEVNIASGVNDTIAALMLNGTTFTTPGTYGSTASGATNPGLGASADNFFSGTGVLTITPEPGSLALAGVATLGLLRRRRRVR